MYFYIEQQHKEAKVVTLIFILVKGRGHLILLAFLPNVYVYETIKRDITVLMLLNNVLRRYECN